MIKESELDRLSTSWAMVRASCLLSRWGTVVEDPGAARDGPAEEGAPPLSLQWVGKWMSQSSLRRMLGWDHFRLRYWSVRSSHSLGRVPMS